jgi:hypothetical protein
MIFRALWHVLEVIAVFMEMMASGMIGAGLRARV